MKIRHYLFVLVALLSAHTAFAQDYSRVDMSLDYSYFRFNPEISQLHSRSLNGGGLSFQYNINDTLGIKAEFMGYSATSFTTTFTVNTPVVNPLGTTVIIPKGTYSSTGDMFTYMFGPVVNFSHSKVRPFGEILFGGSNTNAYANLSTSIGSIGAIPTQHPYTMAVGGGLTIRLSPHFSLKPLEIDYVLTRYSNPLTNVNNQNGFRYVGGFTFGF
jgi:Outer membrane protein beta-barrel domain